MRNTAELVDGSVMMGASCENNEEMYKGER